MVATFYCTKFASSDYKRSDGTAAQSHKCWLSDADASPVTRMSTEVIWSMSQQDMDTLGKPADYRGKLIKVAVKEIRSSKNGLPMVICDLIEEVKGGKAA